MGPSPSDLMQPKGLAWDHHHAQRPKLDSNNPPSES